MKPSAHYYSERNQTWHKPAEDEYGNCLYADGLISTNITATDLPAHYISGMYYGAWGYVSAKGITDMVYVAETKALKLYERDVLYISYTGQIAYTAQGRPTGYDLLITGRTIVRFITAVATYSDYDISTIIGQLQLKQAWADALCPRAEDMAGLINTDR